MSFLPTSLIDTPDEQSTSNAKVLPSSGWIPVLKHPCDFGPSIFFDVSLNLVQNPNITSSHLFRADILADSEHGSADGKEGVDRNHDHFISQTLASSNVNDFEIRRTIVRKLVPRNPQLDRAIAQSCHFLSSEKLDGTLESLFILEPHVNRAEDLPWYHPAVKALAYWHSFYPALTDEPGEANKGEAKYNGEITIYYQLFSEQVLPLASRLLRTARNLLAVIYKHGQGSLAGYKKKVHHDQLISQQRVQDTYSELKARHAKRLCEKWVEQTEPSKHVFEDLGIAAFLIELWKDMYAPIGAKKPENGLQPFPGFVDIGCGNGVLTEVLLLSGYKGIGFDARRRKTWSILSEKTQSCLKETLFVPQPLFDLHPLEINRSSLLCRARNLLSTPALSSLVPPSKPWHNGLFPKGTFIISNHADELTPWTPLLGYLTESPFLAIPCCSHNLSGDRFRAPSVYNSNTADAHAPSFFAANKANGNTKSVAITIPQLEGDDDGTAACPAFGSCPGIDTSEDPPMICEDSKHTIDIGASCGTVNKPETGDLNTLSQRSRAKQPSAYASLCDWVTHLSREVGYDVEREMLRIPSTRNVGLIGRRWRTEFEKHDKEERRVRVLDIVKRERTNAASFVNRCEAVLSKSGGKGHG